MGGIPDMMALKMLQYITYPSEVLQRNAIADVKGIGRWIYPQWVMSHEAKL